MKPIAAGVIHSTPCVVVAGYVVNADRATPRAVWREVSRRLRVAAKERDAARFERMTAGQCERSIYPPIIEVTP